MRRGLLAVLLLTLTPGCASLWLTTELTGMDWSSSSLETAQPKDGVEHRVRVSPQYVPPPPPPEVPAAPAVGAPPPAAPPPPPRYAPLPPPPPGPVVLVPVPLPPDPPRAAPAPPEPLGAAKLLCSVEQRPVHELVHRDEWRYDGVWRALTGFMFVSEAALTGVLLWSSSQIAHSPDRKGNYAVPLVAGIGFGVDAIGTAILIFHPSTHEVKEFERDGQWTSAPGCPAGMAVETPAGPASVTPDGSLDPAAGAFALAQLKAPGGHLALALEGERAELAPTPRGRCDWARAQRVPYSNEWWTDAWELTPPRLEVVFQAPGLQLAPPGK